MAETWMTPEELLFDVSFAVCRFMDGEYKWLVAGFATRSAAERELAKWRDIGDYRIVRVRHEGKEGA